MECVGQCLGAEGGAQEVHSKQIDLHMVNFQSEKCIADRGHKSVTLAQDYLCW